MSREVSKYVVVTPGLVLLTSLCHPTECLSSLHEQHLLEAYDTEDP